ncbi:MAG TPA: hypothetical protein VN844_02520 [Pyrinomonadaceae bacterium]|nr:hypothetical protein [Pyrinomonadaceae bacterium]
MDLGFGAKSFVFSVPGGYTHFSVDGIAVNDRIAKCRIKARGSTSWAMIRTFMIDAWKAVGPPEFEEAESGIRRDYEYPSVLAEYKSLVAARLGPMKSVQVPSDLKSGYEYLISLDENSVVGRGACDYGGSLPIGLTLMTDLVKAGRVDLIENILRGYNPGGRVYALLVLLKLKRKGMKLSDQTLQSMRVVSDLEIPIETCSGCIHWNQTAKAIITDAN